MVGKFLARNLVARFVNNELNVSEVPVSLNPVRDCGQEAVVLNSVSLHFSFLLTSSVSLKFDLSEFRFKIF